MPLVWRNRGLILLNRALSLQKQYKGEGASNILT